MVTGCGPGLVGLVVGVVGLVTGVLMGFSGVEGPTYAVGSSSIAVRPLATPSTKLSKNLPHTFFCYLLVEDCLISIILCCNLFIFVVIYINEDFRFCQTLHLIK